MEHGSSSFNNNVQHKQAMVRSPTKNEELRLPVRNMTRIMQRALPSYAKISQDAKASTQMFNPSSAIRFLTKSIKSKLDWFCPTWGHASLDQKLLWFTEFKKYCKWHPKYDAKIRQIFEIKGEARFRGMMFQERKNYAKNSEYRPKYIPEPVWNQLIHYWASDKNFKNLSVANTANRASTQGSSIHTAGSISMGEKERRMENETGVKPPVEEVFAICHIRKDKKWVDSRAEHAYGAFKKRKAELLEISMSQNQEEEGLSSESHNNMPDDLTIWKEVAPKGKKGKLYGLGSIGTNTSKYTIGSCSNVFKEKNMEQELLKWKEKVKEQERINQEQKQKLEQQQKRIESNESMLATLFEKLNMPLPPNFACATPMQDEPNDVGEASNENNDDNFGFE
ncbi:uncharacterized protein [Medicago truncatula]|uniref:uncharacterized protein n=1 Tax=Medicago truncatula TaxID=3880 RepID=UPI001967BB3B|nr:uncharacterized protein LOC112418539 [Medicago truncatula]